MWYPLHHLDIIRSLFRRGSGISIPVTSTGNLFPPSDHQVKMPLQEQVIFEPLLIWAWTYLGEIPFSFLKKLHDYLAHLLTPPPCQTGGRGPLNHCVHITTRWTLACTSTLATSPTPLSIHNQDHFLWTHLLTPPCSELSLLYSLSLPHHALNALSSISKLFLHYYLLYVHWMRSKWFLSDPGPIIVYPCH